MNKIDNCATLPVQKSELTHEARVRLIAQDILTTRMTNKELIAKYSKIFDSDVLNIPALVRSAYGYIYNQNEATKESIKKLSLERLEQIWWEATDDRDRKSQLKTVDLMNKTVGVYEQEVTLHTDDTITFDIGLNDNKE